MSNGQEELFSIHEIPQAAIKADAFRRGHELIAAEKSREDREQAALVAAKVGVAQKAEVVDLPIAEEPPLTAA